MLCIIVDDLGDAGKGDGVVPVVGVAAAVDEEVAAAVRPGSWGVPWALAAVGHLAAVQDLVGPVAVDILRLAVHYRPFSLPSTPFIIHEHLFKLISINSEKNILLSSILSKLQRKLTSFKRIF